MVDRSGDTQIPSIALFLLFVMFDSGPSDPFLLIMNSHGPSLEKNILYLWLNI